MISWLRIVGAKIRARWSDDDFDDELETHLSLLADKFASRGMTPEDARYAALRQLGNSGLLKEVRNEMQSFAWLEAFCQDLRYGARLLARNKAFAAVAVLTLALGIGANTAIFSVVNAALLRPLPYPQPSSLTILWGNAKRVRLERFGASYPDFLDWRDQSQSFEAMAMFDDGSFALTAIDTPERIPGEYVSQPYFSLLGIRAALGRTFRPEEDRTPQRDAVVLLGDGMWRRRFGADPAVVGRAIQLNGRAYTVIGVAPPGFRGLTENAEVWVPMVMAGSAEDMKERGSRGPEVLARLRKGVSIAQAQAEMDAVSARLAQAYPRTNEARGVEVISLEQETRGDMRKPLLLLLAAVGFVLLIACTNVANLLLARSEARQREISMRTALGASQGRLLRQSLAESAVLVAAGSIGGLFLAHYGARVLTAAGPPTHLDPHIDILVGLFTALISSAAVVVLTFVPAVQLRIAGLHDSIKQTAARSGGSRGGRGFRNGLVVAEIALSMLLLSGASLLIRSLERLAALDLGYDPKHLLALMVTLPKMQPDTADAKMVVTASEILRRVSQIPSVESASISNDVPLAGSNAIFYAAEGQPPLDAHHRPRAYFHRVSPGFMRTLHSRFLAGRAFTEDEVRGNANVAIVTENMVQRFWPGQDPIGKRIKVGGLDSPRPWLNIVGVVGELKYRGIPNNPTADPDLFQVFNERSIDFCVLVRTSLDPASLIPSVRSVLRQAEPSILIGASRTMQEFTAHETERSRFTGWLMATFAAMALLLAVIGIYGVMSYTVSHRTREIGLRMALGADRPAVLRMVIGGGMGLVATGLALGTGAALALARLIGTLLYGVTATDPVSFTLAAVTLGSAALAACFVPASRASRIDAAEALRSE
jgi:predicted permease